mgnify:CR=1 FL=1
MKREERFSIRLNDGTVLPAPLPLERAERVARRAVSEYGRYDVAEIIGDDGEPFITYARIESEQTTQATRRL